MLVESKTEKKKNTFDSTQIVLLIGSVATLYAVSGIAYELFIIVKEYFSERFDNSDLEKLKNRAKQFLPEEIVGIVEKMEAINHKSILKRMALTNDEEQTVLKDIVNRFEVNQEQLKEILQGAHVQLEDGGVTFEQWKQMLKNKKRRISSHSADDIQFSMSGQFVKELLFSKIDNKTWFQLENHPTSFGHVIRHGLDYIRYKISGQNQGPLGSSYFNDKNPLLLKLRIDKTEPLS